MLHKYSVTSKKINDLRFTIDVKFALGIKSINFVVLPKHRCVLALYTQYFPESCETIPKAYVGWDLCWQSPYFVNIFVQGASQILFQVYLNMI